MMAKELLERFWNKVDKSGDCWIWTGCKIKYGYGMIRINHNGYLAHRIAFVLSKQIAIPEGMFVCHHCDNPSCVNPDHLFLGNNADNIKDCCDKQRQARGDSKVNSILTSADIPNIRQMHDKGLTNREIGQHFHVNPSHISRIVHGLKWRHI